MKKKTKIRQDRDEEAEDSFLEIDPLALDREWVEQPRLYFGYARKLAEARANLDEAKANLELVQAELDSKLRAAPERYGLRKVTEGSIEKAIPLQDDYKDAIEEFNRAKKRVGLLDAAVTALDHRKTALENMVRLHGQEYFSSPKAAGGVGEEYERNNARRRIKERRDKKAVEEDEDE